MNAKRIAACVGFLMIAASTAPLTQGRGTMSRVPPQRPLPEGQRIDAGDGDIVVLEDDARIRVVRRRSGMVRAIYSEGQRWVVLLVDEGQAGGAGDGQVDRSYSYQDVAGKWPLPARWEGSAIIEEYVFLGEGPNPQGLGLRLPSGVVQLLMGSPMGTSNAFNDASASTLTYRGGGSSREAGTFDDVEQRQSATAARTAENRSNGSTMTFTSGAVPGGRGTFTGGVSMSAPPAPAPGGAPVRVGGPIRTPRKIVDVPAVYPEQMRQAGATGLVILEITIDAEGAVAAATVLRSIPPLDDAAVAAVKQWRYEPTLLDGRPVPVIMTVTVNFP